MRVCIEKATGKLLGSQSGGRTDADLQVLIDNAVAAGYSAEDIEAKYVDDAEFDTLLAAQPVDTNAQINAQIDQLERQQLLPRGTREFTMYMMVKDAAALTPPMTEPELYAAQVGYRRLKDFDAQIVALRAQRVP